MSTRKKRLLVVFVKADSAHTSTKVQDFIQHGGVDVIVQSDRYLSSYIAIYFKDDKVYRTLDQILKENGFHLLFERQIYSEWAVLKGYPGTIDVEKLFGLVPELIIMAGHKPLTSDIWTS